MKEAGIDTIDFSLTEHLALVPLLCKDFLQLVLIAIAVSLPLSYYLLREWLDNFAYSISLEWFFTLAGLAAMIIAFNDYHSSGAESLFC